MSAKEAVDKAKQFRRHPLLVDILGKHDPLPVVNSSSMVLIPVDSGQDDKDFESFHR